MCAVSFSRRWRTRALGEAKARIIGHIVAITYIEQYYPCDVSVADARALFPGPESAAAASTGKYPSTEHLPRPPGVNADGSQLGDRAGILQGEAVIAEMLGGGNCCINEGQVYARTHAHPATPSLSQR